MYNHTIIEYTISKNNFNFYEILSFITCLGAIIYSLCEILNININVFFQNRYYLYLFNYILLIASIISIINITIVEKLLFNLILYNLYIILV